MNRATRHELARTVAAILALFLLLGVPAPAQDVTEPALKAAYIYRFALFTEWSPDALPAGGPMNICVVGESAVLNALQREVKGRDIVGHAIVIIPVAGSTALPRTCHVVYLSGMSADAAVQLLAGMRDTPVLSLSDIDGFAAAGGIAQYYFEHGHLKFIVNLPAIKRSRLQISSRLLALAKQI